MDPNVFVSCPRIFSSFHSVVVRRNGNKYECLVLVDNDKYIQSPIHLKGQCDWF